jgi:hypothetical protein
VTDATAQDAIRDRILQACDNVEADLGKSQPAI